MSNRVKIENIDGRIWYPGKVAVEISSKLNAYGSVVIDLLREAPDITTTELDEIIDALLANGHDRDKIEIHTGNIVESYDKVRIVKHVEWMYELPTFKTIAPNLDKQKNIVKHFGCLIGRSNPIRLVMAGHMWSHYKDKTFLTYHYQVKTEYHRKHIGLEEIMYYFGTNSPEYTEAINLLQHAPILQDTIKTYPILMPENVTVPCDWYKNFFVDIVCETFSSGNTFFVTEKFWRAVATKTPFIIQGSQYILRRLKHLGFQTFDQWWDEGYDEDPYLYSQNEIKKVLNYIAGLSIDDMNKMYANMQPVLEHNYQRLLTLNFKDFDAIT